MIGHKHHFKFRHFKPNLHYIPSHILYSENEAFLLIQIAILWIRAAL